MTIRGAQKIKVNFPINQYLQQLFCSDTYVKFINPFSFWRRYRINHLDNCWAINIVEYLERCRKIEWQPVRQHQDNEPIKNFIATGRYRSVPWEKTQQNTILIAQPILELKYRGVTYRTSGIVAVNANKVEIKPSLVTLDSSEKLFPSSNNSNNSETSSNLSQPK